MSPEVSGPTGIGVGSWIERRARIAPDRLALIAGDRTTTYGELAARVRRLANGLRALGVGRGDRVGWLGPNHPTFLESLFASGLLGAVLAPVNHRLEPAGIRWVLEDADPVLLITHGPIAPDAVSGSIRHVLAVGDELEGLVGASTGDPVGARVAMDDLCMLSHTSGTTGSPKGVMLTHANVTWNAINFLTCADFRADDVTVAIAPFFRVGGVGVNVLPVLFVGGTVVVPGDTSPDELLLTIERHRVTVGFGNPDTLDALARSASWPSADLSSVRSIITGGAPVPERLIRTYLDHGVALLQGYGLSEAAPLVLLLDPDRALDKVGSAGKPPLFVDVRIAGPDGADVPLGEVGELLVRGPNVMAGYWRRPDTTREVLSPDGWLRTGDAGRSDDEGFVWIVGRVTDRIVAGGRSVHPGAIERVLTAHAMVAEAGVTDIEGGDLVALVVASPGSALTEADLLAHARERLAPHERPSSVLFVDHLPRNSVGKLIRADLRALASARSSG